MRSFSTILTRGNASSGYSSWNLAAAWLGSLTDSAHSAGSPWTNARRMADLSGFAHSAVWHYPKATNQRLRYF